MKNVVKLWSKLLDKLEPEVSLELDEIIYDKKYGHEICVMRLIGKNIFPKMTAEEILDNPKARAGLSKEDIIIITRLDMEIKLNKAKLRMVEHNRNGTVVIENKYGNRKTYLENNISSNGTLLENLNGKHAYSIGYRVGFKEGYKTIHQKKTILGKVKKFFKILKNSGTHNEI